MSRPYQLREDRRADIGGRAPRRQRRARYRRQADRASSGRQYRRGVRRPGRRDIVVRPVRLASRLWRGRIRAGLNAWRTTIITMTRPMHAMIGERSGEGYRLGDPVSRSRSSRFCPWPVPCASKWSRSRASLAAARDRITRHARDGAVRSRQAGAPYASGNGKGAQAMSETVAFHRRKSHGRSCFRCQARLCRALPELRRWPTVRPLSEAG